MRVEVRRGEAEADWGFGEKCRGRGRGFCRADDGVKNAAGRNRVWKRMGWDGMGMGRWGGVGQEGCGERLGKAKEGEGVSVATS